MPALSGSPKMCGNGIAGSSVRLGITRLAASAMHLSHGCRYHRRRHREVSRRKYCRPGPNGKTFTGMERYGEMERHGEINGEAWN